MNKNNIENKTRHSERQRRISSSYRDPSGFTLRMTKWCAFTLAEVLITIAIIGVVAALTIPTLVQELQDKEWSTASEMFMKKLETSMRVMNVNDVLTGYSTTEDFANALQKNFKISKICTNDKLQDCFSDTIFAGDDKTNKIDTTQMKTSADFAVREWGTNAVGVQFGNGVTGLLAYNPYCNANPHDANSDVLDCIALMYDVSGMARPNSITKDIKVTSNINLSEAGNICLAKVAGICVTKTAFKPTAVSKADCLEMVKSGNYGNISCTDENNYWVGAVKTCGGVDKLPSPTQLQQIIKSLYDCGESCTFTWNNYVYNVKLDTKEWSKLTGGSSAGGPVWLWSNSLWSNPWYHTFRFESNMYGWTYTAYHEGGPHAICVGK